MVLELTGGVAHAEIEHLTVRLFESRGKLGVRLATERTRQASLLCH